MTDLVKWNVSTMGEQAPEELSEDELPKDPPGYVPAPVPSFELDNILIADGGYNAESSEEDEEQDDTAILSNARMRLEQGRLYEMLMTSDVFANLDADEQAIKNVHREIRRFAKERMEIMLGMRQTVAAAPNKITSPFNELEVNVLKTLAKKLSGGATEKEAPAQIPKSTTLNQITSKPKAALKSLTVQSTKQAPKAAPVATKAPEPAPTVDPVLAAKKIEDMTYDEKVEYNRQKSAMYAKRKVTSSDSQPMPDIGQMNTLNTMRAGDLGSMATKMLSKINGK